jgi:ABC-2 type transport system ATP-binding protein
VNAIEVVGLGRTFGSFPAVRGVSFTVGQGEIFGYLGANGAGKSSTIRMLCGLLAPTAGRATVAGFDVATAPERVKEAIGYMSQKFSLYLDLPVRENLRFFGGAYGLAGKTLAARIDELVEACDLRGLEQATTGALPGGIRQRLALGCALLHRPKVVFLDEPTACVDPQARRLFWRMIRQLAAQGTTVFVTTHYLDEAEYCARIGLMSAGRLIALDTPAALKARYVPHRLFVLRGTGVPGAAAALAALPGVSSVEPFGAGLHVQVTDARITPADLRARAGEVGVEAVPPSLEDVFLAALKQEEAA